MPSKALLRPGAALEAARRVPGAGDVPTDIDVAATLASRDNFTSDWDDSGQVKWLESARIDLIRGTARLIGEREIEVHPAVEQAGLAAENLRVHARAAVAICTGTKPVIPPIPGLVESRPWTSAEASATNDIPGELLIIGGGVVGCEMATAFADLGSKVHLIARGPNLLSSMEDFAGQAVTQSLRERGIDVRLETEVTSCALAGADSSDLIVDDATSVPGIRTKAALSDGSTIVADQVLVATGRQPNLPQISGVEFARDDDGSPMLDDSLRVQDTNWLYVVGDASGRAHTTHQGKYEARIIGDLIVARGESNFGSAEPADLKADTLAAPQVVFSRPEVASVGLTVPQAQDFGFEVQAYDLDLGAVAGAALHAHDYTGQVRFVVDVRRQTLVGATFVGQDVAEMLHSATIAIIGHVPLGELWHAVPSYPTMSEVWLRFLEEAGW